MASFPTVTLTRDQAGALCTWLEEDIECCHEDVDPSRLMRAYTRIFDAADTQEDGERETCEVRIDPEIAWLATSVLPEMVEEAKPSLAAVREDQAPGHHLRLDQPTRDWLLKQRESNIASHEHFITAARALMGGATDAQLVAA